jgi:hypothetical protein
VLDAALARSDRSRGGRPPYDAVLMFRIWCWRRFTVHRMSSPAEIYLYQLRDQVAFVRFVGLGLHQAVPDAKTVWLYHKQLKQAGCHQEPVPPL